MSPVLAFILVILVCAAGSFVQTVASFGTNIIVMALLPLFLPTGVSLAVALVGGFVTSTVLTIRFRKQICWKHIVLPMVFSVIGTVGGLIMGAGVSSSLLKRMLGVLLVLMAIWQFRFAARVRIPANSLSGGIAGIVSGLLGAFFSISAPPLVLYYSNAYDDKQRYMATLQTVFCIQGLSIIVARMGLAQWTWSSWPYLIACLIGLALGNVPGKLVFDKLDTGKFKIGVYIFMAIAGIYMIITG
ncbi:MAG: sulfite exporter TauE/SafE family protein [Oscillospiraceae bacterium]|nr:sulfite exporter TauE/SafE family protein [Oscillospiraceae bacterium]